MKLGKWLPALRELQNQDDIWTTLYQRVAKKDMQLDVFIIGTANGENTLPSLLARNTRCCVVP
jgi:hypothetical protein